jgi:hypothetical protein
MHLFSCMLVTCIIYLSARVVTVCCTIYLSERVVKTHLEVDDLHNIIIPAPALMQNSHNKTDKCTNVKIIFLRTIFKTPTFPIYLDLQGVTGHQ